VTPNRAQRRHPGKLERDTPLPPDKPESSQRALNREGGPDVADPRAKSSGHGKKTADKWNQ
jgi:hypothetical protein